jgi:hypothetical protein
VRKDLFLLEGEEGFVGASLRGRMTRVIKSSWMQFKICSMMLELKMDYREIGGILKSSLYDFLPKKVYIKSKFVDEF